MHSYAETKPAIRYQYLAQQARDVFARILDLKTVELRFIAEQCDGVYQFSQIVDGFCCRGEIFIKVDLQPARLLSVAAHECRHSFQWFHQRFLVPAIAERDAGLFVLEQQLPTRDSDVQHWLNDKEERQIAIMLASYRINPVMASERKSIGETLWQSYYQPKFEKRVAI